jgi:hypothetical protein
MGLAVSVAAQIAAVIIKQKRLTITGEEKT